MANPELIESFIEWAVKEATGHTPPDSVIADRFADHMIRNYGEAYEPLRAVTGDSDESRIEKMVAKLLRGADGLPKWDNQDLGFEMMRMTGPVNPAITYSARGIARSVASQAGQEQERIAQQQDEFAEAQAITGRTAGLALRIQEGSAVIINGQAIDTATGEVIPTEGMDENVVEFLETGDEDVLTPASRGLLGAVPNLDVESLLTGGDEELVPFGGVPLQYTTIPDFIPEPFGETRPEPPPVPGEVSVEPNYLVGEFRNDARDLFIDKSPSYRAAVQAEMQRAGLLPEGSYLPGDWNDETMAAMVRVMEFANRNLYPGTTRLMKWEEALDAIEAAKPDLDRPQYERLPFAVPQRAQVDSFVEDMFRSQIGRDPFPDELGELGDFFVGRMRQAHLADQDRAQLEFEAEQRRARAQGEADELSGPSGRQPADIEAPASPEQSLQQRIEQSFAPLVERFRQDPERQRAEQSVAGVFAALRGAL